MKIAMTGTSGNMGREALKQTLELQNVEFIRILLRSTNKNKRYAKKLKKLYNDKVQVIFGLIEDKEICKELVKEMDYVIHMAAVIPPLSDNNPQRSYDCNRKGAVALVDAIKEQSTQPKLIHISTIALYGNHNENHLFGRVGDPLLISPFDSYAKDKLYAERYVLDANLDEWVVLRQTAMLHPNMFKGNISDGLMFHTPYNAPLEWVTSRDSGLLIKNILKRDQAGEVPQFWKKIYNIGGGYNGRYTGYDTINDGFAIIGGSIEKFFKPSHFATRNFHGLWLADGDILQQMFDYQRDSFHDYWKEIGNMYPIFKLGRFVPKFLLNLFFFKPLLGDANSPQTWVKNNETAKVQAYFGGMDNAKALPQNWDNVPVLAKGDYGDFDKLRADTKQNMFSHGYDESKKLSELSLEELQKAAEFRGGKCLAEKVPENEYQKIKWQCQEGHIFEGSVFTILGGGHWCPECTMPQNNINWRFDYLSKKNLFFAQLWYDSHDKTEDLVYYIDENGKQQMKKETL